MYLDNIFIYTEDKTEGYIQAICWVLDKLKKFSLYINLKKYQFYQKKVWLLGYIILLQNIYIEDEKIKAVKQ